MWSECPDETRNGSQLPKKNTARVSSYVYRSLSVRNSRAKDKTNLCLTGRTRGVSFWKPKKLPLIANVTSSPSTLYSSPSTLLSKSITLAVWLSPPSSSWRNGCHDFSSMSCLILAGAGDRKNTRTSGNIAPRERKEAMLVAEEQLTSKTMLPFGTWSRN